MAPPRKGVSAYVALGANLGDRLENLRAAVRLLDATPGLAVVRASSVWETPAVGPPQPDYLNAVIEVDACRAPWSHLERLLAIERALGRVRVAGERWGPRPIDIDLLWQGGLSLRGARLELPHPRLVERAFVLAPLAELAPDLRVGGADVATWLGRSPEADRAAIRAVAPLL